MKYIVREHSPAYFDRDEYPRQATVNSPEEALEIPWVKEKGYPLVIKHVDPSICSGASCIMKDGFVVADIYTEEKYRELTKKLPSFTDSDYINASHYFGQRTRPDGTIYESF